MEGLASGRPQGKGRAAEGWRIGSSYQRSGVMPAAGRDLTSGARWKRPRARGLTARSANPVHGLAVAESAVRAGEGRVVGRVRGPVGQPVGEPDAANLQVRFDEGEVETEHGPASEALTTERVSTR